MKIRYIALISLLCVNLYGGDCVPDTLTTLSYLIGHPIKNEEWMKACFAPSDPKHLNNPSQLDAQRLWKQMVKGSELIQLTADSPLLYDTWEPAFWIGQINVKSQEPDNTTGQFPLAHAAIVYFHAQFVDIVNTVEVRNIEGKEVFDFYVERVTYSDFLKRTYLLYSVKPLGTTGFIRWLDLCN